MIQRQSKLVIDFDELRRTVMKVFHNKRKQKVIQCRKYLNNLY